MKWMKQAKKATTRLYKKARKLLLFQTTRDTEYTHLAQRTQCVCWDKVNSCLWLCTLHTLTDLSLDEVARNWLSYEKCTLRTAAVWPFNGVDSP